MKVTIPEKYYSVFEKCGIKRAYEQGSTIYSAAEKARSIYLIVSGRVRVYALTASGKEITFEVLKKGRIFGEAAFAPDTLRRVNIIAITDTVLVECSPSALISALCTEPDLLTLFIRHLSETNDTLTHEIIRLTAYNSGMKVADFLLNNTTERNPLLPYTQDDLAVSLSLNRVTVTRIMKQFKDQKLIDYSYGTIKVINRSALQKQLPEYK